jgi:hypothetical protein
VGIAMTREEAIQTVRDAGFFAAPRGYLGESAVLVGRPVPVEHEEWSAFDRACVIRMVEGQWVFAEWVGRKPYSSGMWRPGTTKRAWRTATSAVG